MNTRGVLSTLARHGAYGLRAALQGPPAPQEPRHGPLPPDYCDGGLWSLPMEGGADPTTMSGSRASTMAWAEAISQAGAALSDEGHEDEAIKCFIVAGSLLEKVEQWGTA